LRFFSFGLIKNHTTLTGAITLVCGDNELHRRMTELQDAYNPYPMKKYSGKIAASVLGSQLSHTPYFSKGMKTFCYKVLGKTYEQVITEVSRGFDATQTSISKYREKLAPHAIKFMYDRLSSTDYSEYELGMQRMLHLSNLLLDNGVPVMGLKDTD
jgi:hypothetical protein